MKSQPHSENDIVIGEATILGGIDRDTDAPVWFLPGGRYTTDRARATEVAEIISEILG